MAGGPSIAVKVLADLKGFTTAVSGAGDHVQGVSTRMRTAFNGVTSGLNQTGILGPFQGVLDGINTTLDTLEGKAKGLGTKLMGAGGAALGVGAGLTAFGSKDQAAQQQLQSAIEATGGSYDDFGKAIEEAISHQEKYGHTANETQNALQALTQATHDPQKALDLLGTASDLAAAKHEDLSTAAAQLGKVYNGSNKVLKEFGVEAEKAGGNSKQMEAATKAATAADDNATKAHQHLSDVQAQLAGKTTLSVSEQQRLRDAMLKVQDADGKAVDAHKKLDGMQLKVVSSAQAGSDNIAALGKVLSGQASASADTFMGKLDGLKAHVEDSIAQFGQKWGPAIQGAGGAMLVLGGAIEVLPAMFGALSAAWGVLTGIELASLAPILLIIGAVAALIAIAWVLYNNWDTIWTFIQTVISDVWDWITSHWPLLLAILTGPIGVAVLIIVNHWDTIKAAIQAVYDWIVGAFQTIGGWIVAPFQWAWTQIQGIPLHIAGAFQAVIDWFTNTFSTIGGYITGPFTAAFDAVADAWNSTVGSLSFSIPDWVPGIGGKGWDVPDIPKLAMGGIVTSPTLALIGEAGPEAVVPLNRLAATTAARTGPVVVVNEAHFHDETDLELFTRKVAWMARTQAV